MKASRRKIKQEIATRAGARPRSPSSATRWKTSAAAAPAWSRPRRSSGLTAVTIDAVDRSGRTPNGQPVAEHSARPRRRLAGLQQRRRRRQRSDLRSTAAMSGTTCSASRRRATASSTRSRIRSRRDGARTRSPSRLRAKATEMVQEARTGRQARRRSRQHRRRRSRPPAASSASLAARRARRRRSRPPSAPPRMAPGRAPGAGGSEWIVFRVTDVTVPPVDFASDDMKKLKETLQRGTGRRAGRAIRHQARNRDRHHHQRGRLRAGDRRASSN